MSRDNVQQLINNKDKLNYRIHDDVSIGRLLAKKQNSIRYSISHLGNIPSLIDKQIHLKNIVNGKYHHIRLKNPNRNADIELCTFFTDYFYK